MRMNKEKDMTPYDMSEKPCRQNVFLLPLIWIASYIATRSNRLTIEKIGMDGLKPPFIVLSEHQGYMDYYISPLSVFPNRANYISDVEGFAAFGKFLYRQIGCLAKRRFTNDISLIHNIKHVINNKDIIFIYPEARHSNVGTNSKLPASTGKLIKLLQVPVVVLKSYGSYLSMPLWDEKHKREVPVHVILEKVLAPSDTKRLTADEITAVLDQHFYYDEYKWQYENKIKISYPKRAEGLHKALYMCPNCKTEFSMTSHDAALTCEACNKSWVMDEYGKLASCDGVTEFHHIPDWYEWQREEVTKQIESGNYILKTEVTIEALPNEKGFIDLGCGTLEHTHNGFYLTFSETKESLSFSSSAMTSVQTEYDYKGKGECIVLSTKDCCYYIYPLTHKACRSEVQEHPTTKEFNVTKIQFAAEAFYSMKSISAKRKTV